MKNPQSRTTNPVPRLLLVILLFTPTESVLVAEVDERTGIWRAVTNDVYIVISGDRVSYYETTKGNEEVGSRATCILVKSNDSRGELEFSIPERADDFTTVSATELTYDSPGNLYPVSVFRAPSLPRSCANALTMREEYHHDPELDFDIVWNQLNDNYAFFAYRGISQQKWNQVYRQYRPKALASEHGEALFAVFSAMLGSTFNEREHDGETMRGDEHIQLSAASEEWNFSIESPGDYRRGRAVLTNPLDGYLKDRIDDAAFEPLVNRGAIWGIYSTFSKLKGSRTGHLLLNSMIDFNPNDSLATGIEDFGVQHSAVTTWMEQVMELANRHHLDRIVVDVRNNLGGFDQIALLIAGYFADQPRLALVKQVRTGGTIDSPELSVPHRELVHPNRTGFAGKVVVLISRHTVSAGETFALAMAQFPHVHLIGESTAGSLSDVLQRHTGNGWVLSLSNEVFHNPAAGQYSFGSALEGKGVQPGKYVFYDAMSHFATGNEEDSMLDVALTTVLPEHEK